MKAKVLIIESNQALLEMWQSYLARHSYEVRSITPEKLPSQELAEWGLPDLIIASTQFSNRVPTGEEYCAQAYGNALPVERKLIPVIQLYSDSMSERQKGILKGVPFRLLQKPVSLPALLDAVNKAAFRHLCDSIQRKYSPLISAELGAQALMRIFQLILAEEKSGAVLVESPSGQGLVFVSKSAVVSADCAPLQGEEAILEILTWTSGNASFYEFTPESALPDPLIPNIQSLLAEAQNEHDEIKNIEKKFKSPSITLHRNEYAQISDKALFADKLFMALEGGKNLQSLVQSLPALSYRQVLVTLAGMLARNEAYGMQETKGAPPLDPKFNAELNEAIKDKWEHLEAKPCAPCSIAVCSASDSLSRRFIGTICGEPPSPFALLPSATPSKSLLLCEMPPLLESSSWDAQDFSGFIMIFDRTDVASLSASLSLLNHLIKDTTHSVCIALPPVPDEKDKPGPQCAELLGISNKDIKVVPISWTPSGCAHAVSALLDLDLERKNPLV